MTVAVWSQTDSIEGCQSNKERKKVAVVLSGGGAKGMAHIGALKVIEKAGIPIDYITGTSMGSIIGGLYAIGHNASVLDSVVRVQDWSYVITDKENLENQSLADRLKQNTYFYSVGMSIGKKNQVAGGIIKGKNLAELFQNLCVGYTDSLDFSNDLPIPFACVATDIIDNTEYDFHSGRLPQAMRASMAIPAAFSPVRMGDHILVDGGLRNNYPADIAREMGADVIIGVTVQGEPKLAEDLGGTMSILSQIIDVNCKNKYDENLAITDVPIRVNTTGYGAASFSAVAIDTLIRRGEEEAMKHWDELIALKKRIGVEESFHPEPLTPLQPEVMTRKHRVVGYVFENMTKQDERFMREKFQLRANTADSIDVAREQQLTTSMRVDLFYQTAECRLVPEGDDVKVVLTAGERKTNQAHVGVRFDSEEYASVQLGVDIPLKGPVPMNADFVLRLGKRVKAGGELTIHPRSFTRPTLSYTFRRNDIDIYVDGHRDYNILFDQHQAALVPINFDVRHFNFQIGARWDYQRYRNKLEAENSTEITLKDDHYFSYRASLTFNNENDWYFPSRGASLKAEYAYVTDNFAKLDDEIGMSDVSGHWRVSIPLSNRFTIQPMVYGRFLFGTAIPLIFTNSLGGNWFGHYLEHQMPFAGIGNVEYAYSKFAAVQLQAQEQIGTSLYVQLRLAAAQSAETLDDLFSRKTGLGGQLAIYYKTMFGPVGASLGYSNVTKKPNLYINLGYVF